MEADHDQGKVDKTNSRPTEGAYSVCPMSTSMSRVGWVSNSVFARIPVGENNQPCWQRQ